jgi:hypothetical protein
VAIQSLSGFSKQEAFKRLALNTKTPEINIILKSESFNGLLLSYTHLSIG